MLKGLQPARHGRVLRTLRGVAPETLLVLLGLVIFSWKMEVPGPWRDESATVVIARRSTSQILELAGNIDLVHLTYYLIAHSVFALLPAGSDPDTALIAARWVSVVAGALTAGVMVRIGRQLDSTFLGTTAGLLFLASPLASRYAQEARSYALVVLAGACATWALLDVCRRPRARGWKLYGASIAVTALLNVLSLLLLLVVHAAYVLAGERGAVRRRWFSCAAGTMAVLSPYVAMTFGQRTQVSWIDTAPDLSLLRDFLWLEYRSFAVPLIVIIVALAPLLVKALRHSTVHSRMDRLRHWAARRSGVVVLPSVEESQALARTPVTVAASSAPAPQAFGSTVLPPRSAQQGPAGSPASPGRSTPRGPRSAAARSSDRPPGQWHLPSLSGRFSELLGVPHGTDGVPRHALGSGPHHRAFWLGLAWSLLPPVLLWCVSQAHPLFTYRYIVFSLPGTALLLASLTPLLRPLGALLPLLAVTLSGLNMQLVYRDPVVGHSEDVNGVTRYIAANAMQSDGLLFITEQMRLLPEQYPDRFRGLQDLAADRGALETASLVGTEVMPETVARRIAGHTRIWLITGPMGLAGPKTEADTAKVAALYRDYRISQHTTFLQFEVFLFTLVPTPSREERMPAPVGLPQPF